MDSFVAGAENLVDERIAYADARGLSHRVGDTYRLPAARWRVVWHKMEAPEDDPDTPADEGWELAQARSYIIAHRTPPHLWALPEHDWVGQTVPLDRSAYALRHEAGDPETNHAHAIQIEVIGFAKDGLDDPDLCDWLGRRVLRPILDAGVPVSPFIVAPSTGPDGYGENGKVRFTWQQWANFGGQCGHANVPGNQHWDPGKADYLAIARAATGTTPTTDPPEDDMKIADCKTRPALVVGAGGVKRVDKAQRDALRSLGVEAKLVSEATSDALWSLRDPSANVDVGKLAAEVAARLGGNADAVEIEAAMRRVLDDTRLTTG